MKCLVVGVGSIGQRHLRNLRSIGIEELAVCEIDERRRQAVVEDFPFPSFAELPHALVDFKPDVVLVCTIPSLHVTHALEAIRAGAHVFIEKPLSHQLTGVEQLIDAAEQRERIVQVGYNLRFHPGLQRVKALLDERTVGQVLWARAEFGQYLPDWRPTQDYRQSYTARSSMGGGILLDSSHELDYMTWLLGEPASVMCMAGKVSRLDVDVEDSATVMLQFENGSQAAVHVDFVQRAYSRSCILAGEDGTITWDFVSRQVRFFSATSREWEVTEHNVDINETYISEIKHFFSCVEAGTSPLVDLRQARRVLDVVIAAKTSAAEGRRVALTW